ncbi:hypothetical protein KAI46_04995 [bacterium]|nr:hypothetical protein [bacterium]
MLSTLRTLLNKFMGLIFLFSLVFYSQSVFANTYTDSAHGSSSYGVERTAWTAPYVPGNCAHCHEQHTAEADGHLLIANSFSDVLTQPYVTSTTACFACHAGITGSLQNNPFNNYDYSATFGGASATTSNIMAAFNQPSYHNLNDVKRYITGYSGTKSFSNFPAETNPCSGCHNVHIARANKRYPGHPTFTAISRPSDHENLWGDEEDNTSELMTSYGSAYQPPIRSGSNLEPDGVSSSRVIQAAKTPNYNALCIDCHNSTNIIYSTTLGRNLLTFNWSLEVHGQGEAHDWYAEQEILPPYSDSNLGNYVLSCMDCHEPHGSPNTLLIRSRVNGSTVVMPPGSSYWNELCKSCHLAASELQNFHHKTRLEADYSCTDCHYSDKPNADPVSLKPCYPCHHHGSSTGGFKTF